MKPERYVNFGCPYCGQIGDVTWSGDGEDRVLIELSEGFHVEEGRLPGVRHVIICNVCDEIDPVGLTKLAP